MPEERRPLEHLQITSIFQERKQNGSWPADQCPECQRRGYGRIGSAAYCVSYAHHVGDCCLHCGNEERGSRVSGRVGKLR